MVAGTLCCSRGTQYDLKVTTRGEAEIAYAATYLLRGLCCLVDRVREALP